jgi:integrase/recombinase XerC
VIQRFLDYIAVERKYSPRTVGTYGDDLREFCAFLGVDEADFDPTQVDESDVKTWVYELAEVRRNAPRSVHQKLSALHSLYSFLLREGLVKKDVTRRVLLPKLDKPLPKFFKPQEMEKLSAVSLQHSAVSHQPSAGSDLPQLSDADDFIALRDYTIIEVLYQTGMRQAELLGLQDADLNLGEGSVRIFGKRSKERIVPIGDRLIEQLRDYLAAREAWMPGVVAPALFVRRDRHGEMQPLNQTTLYNIVRTRMGEVSTQQKRSPHVLRHTFATTMLDNGADIRTIQTLLGHANLRATQIYTHATFSQMQKAYENAHPRAKRGKKEE